MRLCSLWDPGTLRPLLCAIVDGELRALGSRNHRFGDVAELLDRTAADAPDSLEVAVDRVGIEDWPLARWDAVSSARSDTGQPHLVVPIRPVEVWAAGVTYERSRDARMLEAREATVYDRVYAAERPELFFKATGARVVGTHALIGLRADATWQVPEPELALVIGAGGAIIGYTLGNDVSSRDIEGENPLYLPQAKIFAGSCALGPVVVSAQEIPDPYDLEIRLRITRAGATVFEGATSTRQLHVRLETLVRYLAAQNWLAPATVLLTGTGIVPPDDFTLQPGDCVAITCPAIGTLQNDCAPAAELAPPPGWWTPQDRHH